MVWPGWVVEYAIILINHSKIEIDNFLVVLSNEKRRQKMGAHTTRPPKDHMGARLVRMARLVRRSGYAWWAYQLP